MARLLALLPLPLVCACVLAASARAETVRLRDGRSLEARAVAFLDAHLEVTLEREGGTARVLLRYEQLDPADVLPLWDRTHTPDVAADVLRSAQLALALEAWPEAANRFDVAARLDPTLRPAARAGFAAIRAHEVAAALRELEELVRMGHDPRGAAALGRVLLAGEGPAALPAPERRRVAALVELAERLVARAEARDALPALPAAPAPVAPPPVAAAPAPPPAPTDAVLDAVRAHVAVLAAQADEAREAAADVTLPLARVRDHLERAAAAWLHARRLVREAPSVLREPLAELGEDLRLALVATWLDLADLYRQEGWLDEARARVRAALILDPGNEDAWAQRRLIEDDLRRSLPFEDPYGPGVVFTTWRASPFLWPGGGCGCPRAVPYGGLRLRFGFGHGAVRIRSEPGRRR